MDSLARILASDALNAQVVSGVSLAFVLIFVVPLAIVAALFWIYCAFAQRSVVRVAQFLSLLWVVACIPAGLMLLMGAAFSPGKGASLLLLPVGLALGLLLFWLPVALRRLFRILPA